MVANLRANDVPARKREMAELLAEGHETGAVATIVGVSAGRVSQMRSELAASWRAFQGELEGKGGPMPVRPRV